MNCEPEDLPDLDDLFLRFGEICNHWNWKETPDLQNLNMDPPLKKASSGIYNRAVVILGDQSSFTAGLEAELNSLKRVDESELNKSVLGSWISDNEDDNQTIHQDNELLEVLPLNTEQRQATLMAMNKKLTVITGPPGTGKSQVVSTILVNAAWKGKRVLFASKNNKAIDVVEYRVNGLASRPILLRLGANQYQNRLADYFTQIMGMNPTNEDKIEYAHLKDRYKNILDKKIGLIKKEKNI